MPIKKCGQQCEKSVIAWACFALIFFTLVYDAVSQEERIEQLITQLEHADGTVRQQAYEELLEHGKPDAINAVFPVLIEQLGAESKEDRIDATYRLRDLGTLAHEAVPDLLKALEHEKDASTRVLFAEALVSIDPTQQERVLPELLQALENPVPLTRPHERD